MKSTSVVEKLQERIDTPITMGYADDSDSSCIRVIMTNLQEMVENQIIIMEALKEILFFRPCESCFAKGYVEVDTHIDMPVQGIAGLANPSFKKCDKCNGTGWRKEA